MNGSAQAISIVALIVALVALVLGWMAYNRTGEDVEAMVEREIDEARVEFEASLDDLEATLRQSASDAINNDDETATSTM